MAYLLLALTAAGSDRDLVVYGREQIQGRTVLARGTGYAICPHLALTARHVVSSARGLNRPENVFVLLPDSPTRYRVRRIAVGRGCDVAILVMQDLLPRERRELALADPDAERFAVFGRVRYPLARHTGLSSIMVNPDCGHDLVTLVSAHPRSGQSGTAVFTQGGKLIGIVTDAGTTALGPVAILASPTCIRSAWQFGLRLPFPT